MTKAWEIILASAAIGALMSSLFMLVGQYWERKSRRREMLLNQAVHLAIVRSEQAFKVQPISSKPVRLYDPSILVGAYYRNLKYTLENEKSPEEVFELAFESAAEQGLDASDIKRMRDRNR